MRTIPSFHRGSGLIIAISVLAMLAIMATSFITLMRLDMRVTKNYLDDQRCEMLAHGMLNYFKSLLREDLNRTWGKYENRDAGIGYVSFEWTAPGDNSKPATLRIPGIYQKGTILYDDEQQGVPVSDDAWFCAPLTTWGTTGGDLYSFTHYIAQQSFAWDGRGILGRYYVNYKDSTSGRDYNIWLGRSQNAFAGDGTTVYVGHPDAAVPIDDDMDGNVNPRYWSWDDGWGTTTWRNENAEGSWYYDNPPFVIHSGPTNYQCGSRMTGERTLPGGICWQWGVKVGPTHSGYANLNVHGNVDAASSSYLDDIGGLGLMARQADDERVAKYGDSDRGVDHLGRIEWKGFRGEYESTVRRREEIYYYNDGTSTWRTTYGPYYTGFPQRYNNVMYAPAAANLEKLFRRYDYENYEYTVGRSHPPNVGADPAKARALVRYRWGSNGVPATGHNRWRVGWRRDGASYYKFPSPENPLGDDRYYGPNEVMEHDHTVDHPGTSAVAAILGDIEWRKVRPYVTMWSTDTILRGKIWPGEGYSAPGDWRHMDILKRVNPNIIGAKGPEGLSGEDADLKSKWAAKSAQEKTRLFYMLLAAMQFTSTPNASEKACQFIASLTDMVDRDQEETYYAAPNGSAWALGVEKQPVINEIVFYSRSNANTPDYQLFRMRVELYNPMENIPWIPDKDEEYAVNDYMLKIGTHEYRVGNLSRFTEDPNEEMGTVDQFPKIGADGMYGYPVEGWKPGGAAHETWSRYMSIGWSKTVNWPPGVTKEELEAGLEFSLWKPLRGQASIHVGLDPGKVEELLGQKCICVDKTPVLRLVQPYGPGSGKPWNGPGAMQTIYLGTYRRWDPMNARVFINATSPVVDYGEDDQCNVLWCPGWNIVNFPTLGRPNTGYMASANTRPAPGTATSVYGYERLFERNFKVVDGDIPSIGWLGELMMRNCAQDGPLTWVHTKAQEPVRNAWEKYRFMNELDTKGKFDLYRPFRPARKYEPGGNEVNSINLHVLDIFTVWDPSNDGIDNDGDGAVDDYDTGRQPGDKCGPEIRVFGKLDLNNIPAAVMSMTWPDGETMRNRGRVTKPLWYCTRYGPAGHRQWTNYGPWGPYETIGDFLRADRITPYPGTLLCGSTWYNTWGSAGERFREYGLEDWTTDNVHRYGADHGDDDGDGIADERDERDMVFTWVANHFTTRANVFEIDVNARVCQPYYHPGRKLPYHSYKSHREFARKQLIGILDRSTILRVNPNGTCDFTGPVEIRMLRASDDLRVY